VRQAGAARGPCCPATDSDSAFQAEGPPERTGVLSSESLARAGAEHHVFPMIFGLIPIDIPGRADRCRQQCHRRPGAPPPRSPAPGWRWPRPTRTTPARGRACDRDRDRYSGPSRTVSGCQSDSVTRPRVTDGPLTVPTRPLLEAIIRLRVRVTGIGAASRLESGCVSHSHPAGRATAQRESRPRPGRPGTCQPLARAGVSSVFFCFASFTSSATGCGGLLSHVWWLVEMEIMYLKRAPLKF
jgi:hypothetical protein